jgi:hypothetical protein
LISFNERVLLTRAQQLWKSRQQTFNANSGYFDKLTGDKVLARLGAQRY